MSLGLACYSKSKSRIPMQMTTTQDLCYWANEYTHVRALLMPNESQSELHLQPVRSGSVLLIHNMI